MNQKPQGSIGKYRGKWCARVRWIEEDGTKREKRQTAPTRTEAGDLRDKLLRETIKELKQTSAAPHQIKHLIQRYREDWVYSEWDEEKDARVPRLKSAETVESHLTTIERFIGDVVLEKLTPARITRLKDNIAEEMVCRHKKGDDGACPDDDCKGWTRSTATVNRILVTLRRMLNIAIDEHWLERTPFPKGLLKPTDEIQRQRTITIKEEDELLKVCAEAGYKQTRVFIIAAVDTGCRRSELLNLTTDDVDLKNGLIDLRRETTKTEEGRPVPISARLKVELLKLMMGKGEGEPLFTIDEYQLRREYEEAREAAGLADVRIHDLRHCFGTRTVQAGLNVAEVARLLGHKRLETSFRYMNVSRETVDRGRAAIDGLREEKTKQKDQPEAVN